MADPRNDTHKSAASLSLEYRGGANESGQEKKVDWGIARTILAAVVGVAVLVYLMLIVGNIIPKDNRLTAVEAGIIAVTAIVVGVLLNPGFLDRLSLVKLPGGIEMTLKELERKQERQQSELNDVRFMLTYLLTVAEHAHLQALALGKADDYDMSESLRQELRKLLRLGLVEEEPGRSIDEIRDGERIDLKRFVKLKARGLEYLRGLVEPTR